MEENGRYIIEMIRIGNQVKATACDPSTGLEVSVIAPANIMRKDLYDLAVKKLKYRIKKIAAE